jgi:probable rRNA maturation factor
MRPQPDGRFTAPVIDIQTQSLLWQAQPAADRCLREAITAAAQALSTAGGEVSIVLTDDSDLRRLNRDWRGIDTPTNVLSFPAAPAGGHKFLGDIVIAYETLARECADEQREFLHHLAHLAVHGYLHLCGHDHATDAQAEAMESLESRIMRAMKMPDPYAVRGLDRERGEA